VTAPARPPGLPRERTELAWRRTGLAVATAAAVAGRALYPVLATGAVVLGVLGLVLAVLLLVGGTRRSRHHGVPGGGFLAAVVVGCVAIGIAALVVVVAVRI
jgi:hypothetical protein